MFPSLEDEEEEDLEENNVMHWPFSDQLTFFYFDCDSLQNFVSTVV